SVMETLRSMEVGLLVKELTDASRAVTDAATQIENASRMAQEEHKRAERADEKNQRNNEHLAEIEQQIEGLWAVQQSGLMAYERAESDLKLAQQKLSSLNESEQDLGQEASNIQSRIEEAINELEALRKEVANEQEMLERLRIECGGAGEEAQLLA